jgi:hypothetical protein
VITANSKTIDAGACSPAGVAADLDADAEAALKAVREIQQSACARRAKLSNNQLIMVTMCTANLLKTCMT